MKVIVITGSTRGIGLGLGAAFLDRGNAIVINGRTQAGVEAAIKQLSANQNDDRLLGVACDVTQLAQVEALWEAAVTRFGRVDLWINNAGIGHAMLPAWELPAETIRAIMETNVNGVIYGSKVAIQGMIGQGGGQLYNMLGHGARGHVRDGMGIYGTTKAAVNYLTRALISETRGLPIQIGTLSPGMVKTDLLMDRLNANPELLARNRRLFSILAERVETVAPWMADEMMANRKTGVHIRWLTPSRMIWRFLSAPFAKRDLFEEQATSLR